MTDREEERRARLRDPETLGATASTGLFVLALIAAITYAKPVLFPIVLALLLNFLLRNPVRWLEKVKIPKPVGAGLLILLLVGGMGFGGWQLREPAMEWLANAPRSLEGFERKVRRVTAPVKEVSEAAAQVEEMTDVQGEQNRRRGVQQVEVKEPSLLETVMTALPQMVASAVVTLVLLYLLLLFAEEILGNVVQVLPSLEEKRRVVQIARQAESAVSRYLLIVTVINAGLGVAVAIALGWIGVPNPWLWGVMAGLLNFVPYIGGVVGVTIVAIVAFSTLDDTMRVLAAPAAYTVLNSMEGLVITPIVLGKRFSLSPVIIFVWLLLWGWLWGIGGALIAVPLLTVFKIYCDYTPSLNKIGQLLARG